MLNTKRSLFLLLILLAAPAFARSGRHTASVKSARNFGPAGCGLGSSIIGKKPGFSQVFAVTSNDSISTQFFGITSGTSNCIPNTRQSKQDLSFYFEGNSDAIASDMARGQGESLENIGYLLGCKDQNLLAGVLKDNYSKVFSAYDVSPLEASGNLHDLVLAHPELSRVCSG